LLKIQKIEIKQGIIKAPIKPMTYLWNVAKCRRKEYLRTKISLKLFIAIFGRQNDINELSKFAITVPEPFRFGSCRE
jgi:hypothetical protein